MWIYTHGAPKAFSAQHELCRSMIRSYLTAQGINVRPRPTRSSHKKGKVERKNGVFKIINVKTSTIRPIRTSKHHLISRILHHLHTTRVKILNHIKTNHRILSIHYGRTTQDHPTWITGCPHIIRSEASI